MGLNYQSQHVRFWGALLIPNAIFFTYFAEEEAAISKGDQLNLVVHLLKISSSTDQL